MYHDIGTDAGDGLAYALHLAREAAVRVQRRQRVSEGHLLLTNERVLLVPPSKTGRDLARRTTGIGLDKVVSVRTHEETTLLMRRGKQHFVLHPHEEPEALPVLLRRVLTARG